MRTTWAGDPDTVLHGGVDVIDYIGDIYEDCSNASPSSLQKKQRITTASHKITPSELGVR